MLHFSIDFLDLLLRALASYKRHDPAGGDEYEHMENLFDALCASLMFAPNRQIFLDGEGLQLMILMLRSAIINCSNYHKIVESVSNPVRAP